LPCASRPAAARLNLGVRRLWEFSMGLTLLVGIILLLNAFASVVVLRAPVFSPVQRFLQIALIWLVPIIGAVICSAFAYSQALGPASPGTMDPLYLPSDGG